MLRVAPSLRRSLPAVVSLSVVISFATWVGCGNDDDNSNNNGGGGGATTSSFTGWFANGNESGRLTVTVNAPNLARGLLAPRAAVTASGSLTPTGGAPVPLTGTFDDTNGDLNLSGGGYALGGIYDIGPPGNFFGGYTGPNGGGQFSCASGSTSGMQVYGGDYLSDVTAGGGTFLLSLLNGVIEGVATETGDSLGLYFTGTATGTGTTRTIAISGSDAGYDMTGTGTLNTSTNHISGRYNVEFSATPVDSGAWSGDLITP